MQSWCTFNEPGVYTFSGYCMGGFPPAKAMHLRTAGRVLKHMLIAHTDAYRLIKSMPGARSCTHVTSTLVRPLHVCHICCAMITHYSKLHGLVEHMHTPVSTATLGA